MKYILDLPWHFWALAVAMSIYGLGVAREAHSDIAIFTICIYLAAASTMLLTKLSYKHK